MAQTAGGSRRRSEGRHLLARWQPSRVPASPLDAERTTGAGLASRRRSFRPPALRRPPARPLLETVEGIGDRPSRDGKDETAGRLEPFGVVIHDWPDPGAEKNLDDVAAKIASLDLVITVDNTTAHLAGALGVPVWTLLPAAADWRWMTGRDDSLWYAGMTLFRQTQAGDWTDVFSTVANRLLAQAISRAPAA